jgi:hypothetical protein
MLIRCDNTDKLLPAGKLFYKIDTNHPNLFSHSYVYVFI